MTEPEPAAGADPRDPEEHLAAMVAWYARRVADKYRAGQAEHGGRVWRKPMLGHVGEEILDLTVYYNVLQAQHARLVELLGEARAILRQLVESPQRREGLEAEALDRVAKADNLARCGNVDGVDEVELNPSSVAA